MRVCTLLQRSIADKPICSHPALAAAANPINIDTVRGRRRRRRRRYANCDSSIA